MMSAAPGNSMLLGLLSNRNPSLLFALLQALQGLGGYGMRALGAPVQPSWNIDMIAGTPASRAMQQRSTPMLYDPRWPQPNRLPPDPRELAPRWLPDVWGMRSPVKGL